MSDLTPFEIIVGIVAILFFFLTVIGITRNTLRTYKQKRQKAEKRFRKEFAQLRAAGGTISARSGLSFLILAELGSVREAASTFRYLATVFLLFCAIMLLFAISMKVSLIDNQTLLVASYIAAWASFILGFVMHFILGRLTRYTDFYEDLIKEVWERPVKQRSSKSVGPIRGSK